MDGKTLGPHEAEKPKRLDKIRLKSDTIEKAKKLSTGYDIYALESDWKEMLTTKNSIPDKPDGSFINFVKWYVKENGACPRSTNEPHNVRDLFE